ncbi:hypothetical protein MRB53_041487 [Persea americana]|nr:hypothetical protein MRB53_041487 [Persea americana]
MCTRPATLVTRSPGLPGSLPFPMCLWTALLRCLPRPFLEIQGRSAVNPHKCHKVDPDAAVAEMPCTWMLALCHVPSVGQASVDHAEWLVLQRNVQPP